MHWTSFIILTWLLILIQSTVGRVLVFETISVGTIGPDLLASLGMFVALCVHKPIDAMIAGWLLGLALDITTAGGAGSATVIGPMAIAYALGVRAVFAVREAFFCERALTRIALTLLFCLFTHLFWVTAQSLLAYEFTTWSQYGRMLIQAMVISVYSAILAPLMLHLLWKARRRLIPIPSGRIRRGRR